MILVCTKELTFAIFYNPKVFMQIVLTFKTNAYLCQRNEKE